MSYYKGRLDALADLFGTNHIRLDGERLTVADRSYPILDDVIVLLDPSQYPEAIVRRLGVARERTVDGLAACADDIQFTFGEEWQRFPEILPEHEEEFRSYFDLIEVEALGDRRICDLGCGIGRWSYFLKDRCLELILVDFSEAIFVARRNLRDVPNALFFMGDLQRLPFRDGFADLLVSLGVLHHLPSDALRAVRQLHHYAPRFLFYVYYALDNRPSYFHWMLALVTALRRGLVRIRSPAVRGAITRALAALVYLPLIAVGRILEPFGLSRRVPLYETYHRRSWEGICQDVYDRFFTRIEQRFSREEVLKLRDTFRNVVVSEQPPYWHFLCEQ